MSAPSKANALEEILQSLSSLSYNNIFLYRAAVDIVLRKRNLSFSIGELGEKLFIEYFNATPGLTNLQLAPTGTKNVDAPYQETETGTQLRPCGRQKRQVQSIPTQIIRVSSFSSFLSLPSLTSISK